MITALAKLNSDFAILKLVLAKLNNFEFRFGKIERCYGQFDFKKVYLYELFLVNEIVFKTTDFGVVILVQVQDTPRSRPRLKGLYFAFVIK